MPNGRDHLKYEDFGNHEYAKHDGTSDCAHGCGCWAGPARSGGPVGVDPFGKCPDNPLKVIEGYKTIELTEAERLADLVNSRIAYLEKKVSDLEPYAALVQKARKSSKTYLQVRVKQTKEINVSLNRKICRIEDQLKHILSTMV